MFIKDKMIFLIRDIQTLNPSSDSIINKKIKLLKMKTNGLIEKIQNNEQKDETLYFLYDLWEEEYNSIIGQNQNTISH